MRSNEPQHFVFEKRQESQLCSTKEDFVLDASENRYTIKAAGQGRLESVTLPIRKLCWPSFHPPNLAYFHL